MIGEDFQLNWRKGLTIIILLIFTGCHLGVKEKLHKTGEKAGEAVGETVQGISAGLETAFAIRVDLSESLQKQGLALGRITLGDSSNGIDNLLITYVIFNQDFKKEVLVKVFDHNQLEMGRSRVQMEGRAGEAKYFSFLFDPHTNIDRDSRIVME